MPLGNFDLYDILADIIPGSYALFLLGYLALPTDFISSNIPGTGAAVLFVAMAYIAGRLARNTEFDLLYQTLSRNISWISEEVYKAASDVFTKELFIILNNSDDHKRVQQRIQNDFLNALTGGDTSKKPGDSGMNQFVHAKYSELYGSNSLYHRYTIVGEFYNGLMNISLLASFGYGLAWLGKLFLPMLGTSTPWTKTPPFSKFLVFVALVAIFIIAARHHVKFEKRRAAAFLHEIDQQNSNGFDFDRYSPDYKENCKSEDNESQ